MIEETNASPEIPKHQSQDGLKDGFYPAPRGAASGRVSLIMLMVILVAMAWGGKLMVDYYMQKKSRISATPEQTEAPAVTEADVEPAVPELAPLEPREPTVEAPPTPPPAQVEAPPKPPGIEDLDSLKSLKFPITLRVIEPFSLLNNAGQETKIPLGQTITIHKRSALGTLTIDIKGLLYAGNESRLIYKVGRP